MHVCPSCKSEQVSPSFRKHGADYFSCQACGMTFISPRPELEALQKHYDKYGRQYYSAASLKEYFISREKYRREIALLMRTTRRGTLLDVGCSVGGFVKIAMELGYAAEGIDISSSSVEEGQKLGLPLRCGDFLRETLKRQFDVITMWATLEHLPEPDRYLEQVEKCLRSGGVFLSSVPNFNGITYRLIGQKCRYVGIDHLNYWTRGSLQSFLARFGFKIFETITYGFDPFALISDLLMRSSPLSCEQMGGALRRAAALKRSPIGRVHRAVERLLNLASLGDVIAVAACLQG